MASHATWAHTSLRPLFQPNVRRRVSMNCGKRRALISELHGGSLVASQANPGYIVSLSAGHSKQQLGRLTREGVTSRSLSQPFLSSPKFPRTRASWQTHSAVSASTSFVDGGATFAEGATDRSSGPNPCVNVSADVHASFWDRMRAVAFYTSTFLMASILFLVMLVQHPLVLLLDWARRRAQHTVNDIWAKLSTIPFYKTEVVGSENLPGPDEAVVYVANHLSMLDVYTLFQLRRPFKFISKTSNFFIPFVGWAMFLTGHVPLRRMDKKSHMDCLKQCVALLRKGVPVLFFPEGTRSKDGKLAAFKKGAFTIAVKAGVPVVPITLIGTSMLMPNGREGVLFSQDVLRRELGLGAVRIVVHPAIKGSDPDELCQKARRVIAQDLLDQGLDVADA